VRGLAHFAAGVAVATFFPEIVRDAASNLGFGPLLGGLAGLLPDTLDFKFSRYFYPLDESVDPAVLTASAGYPDPQAMATQIASAIDRAYDSGRRVRIQLHTQRLSSDLWRQYSVTLGQEDGCVVVRLGPAVTTGQVPHPGSEVPGPRTGRAQVRAPVQVQYQEEIQVDIFSGPTLAFQRVGSAVEVVFLPWHRAWTHSLVMAIVVGAIGWLLGAEYGLVMALALLAHVFTDQLGHMGSNLFFPLTHERTPGLGLFHAGDAVPNLMVVWLSGAVIFFNLDRFSATPSMEFVPYGLGAVLMPCLLLAGASALARWRARRQRGRASERRDVAAQAAFEALDATNQIDI
jgi:hypothetical protein